jgi:hypothetical protein
LDGVPTSWPAIGTGAVFVPALGGGIEAYPIDEAGGTPTIYRGAGAVMAPPTASPLSLSWPSEGSYLYLSHANTLNVFARLETRQQCVASTSRQPPNSLFAATLGGHVYCLDETNGHVLWRGSTGEPITQSPVPIGESLYVVSDHAGMFSLSARNGEEHWHFRGIQQFVAGSAERVYCTTEDHQLVALNAQSGSWLGGIPIAGLDLITTNFLTDRLYVGTTSGTIQCLREIQQDWPLRHAPEPAEQTTAAEDQPAGQAEPPGPLPDDLSPAEEPAPQQPAFDVFGPFGDEPAPGAADDAGDADDSPDDQPVDPFGDLGDGQDIFDF